MMSRMLDVISQPEVRARYELAMADPIMRAAHRLSCKEAQNKPETKRKMREALQDDATKNMLLHYDEICFRIKAGEKRKHLAEEFNMHPVTFKRYFRGIR